MSEPTATVEPALAFETLSALAPIGSGIDPNPRRGLPSASTMLRTARCPGWVSAALGLPDVRSEDAERGARIHRLLEKTWGGDYSVLTSAPTDEARRAMEIKDQMRVILDNPEMYFTRVGGISSDSWIMLAERRLWSVLNEFSGQFDVALINEPARLGLILDAKSGWSLTPAAPDNLQLRTLAVLAASAWALEEVVVGVVQPTRGKPDVARYNFFQLAAARTEIHSYVAASQSSRADRRPSAEGCKYCPALGTDRCPEVHQVMIDMSLGKIPASWPAALDSAEVAQLVIDDLRKRAKSMLKSDPASIPGYSLTPGKKTYAINDTATAFKQLEGIMNEKDLVPCTKLMWGKLIPAFATVASLKQGPARAALLNHLSGNITEATGEPTLKKDADALDSISKAGGAF